MIKKIVLAHILALAALANSDYEIANSLKNASKINNIDARVLYTIAKIESAFDPFIISFVSDRSDFRFDNVDVKVAKFRSKKLINISSKSPQTLIKIAHKLIDDGYKIDVGLMQINSQNFSKNELNQMFDLDKNIKAAAKILKSCNTKYQTMQKTIECYNKGFKGAKSLDYFTRFKNSFNRDFGGAI